MNEHELPRIGAPATRALAARGIQSLEQAAALGEKVLLGMHGVGPKAISILRETAKEIDVELGD
ncbi:DNA-binding protein [Arthrobacter sp. MYb227]|uniref:DNA-binding protein n=1 Tax=Arthrobacter sp. MYb227 TaxID=1848601 RepID=UPI000CFBAA27|nr:DNA-binding protein [Arthrobacter sp. MYb227]PQZ90321.1 DNA-binding protein [Arthrobacter sp. MYb227]